MLGIEVKREVYHFSNEGVCSWYDFAVAIVAATGNACEVLPCTSADFPSKVTRPSYSVLDKTKLKTDFGYRIPYWRDSFFEITFLYEEIPSYHTWYFRSFGFYTAP